MINLNFVLSLTSVLNIFFSLPVCFKWKDDTFRKSISRAFTDYCSDKSPCNLRNRYIVIDHITLFSCQLDLGIFFLFLSLSSVTLESFAGLLVTCLLLNVWVLYKIDVVCLITLCN